MKTYKREVAAAILAFVAALTAFAAWGIVHRPNPATSPLLVQLVTAIAVPGFMFAALAFGLDWRSKQSEAPK